MENANGVALLNKAEIMSKGTWEKILAINLLMDQGVTKRKK